MSAQWFTAVLLNHTDIVVQIVIYNNQYWVM